MSKVVIIHGCPSDELDKSYNRHWMPWVQKKLEARGVKVLRPTMPESWKPNYQAFKTEFEKLEIDEDDTLIGHSCGCAFLVRWLGQTKQKIKRLVMVAPWKVAPSDDLGKKAFYEYDIDNSVKDKVGEVIIFTADNEDPKGKRSAKIFHDALGGQLIELPGRGHYIIYPGHMESEEFPELLDILLDQPRP